MNISTKVAGLVTAGAVTAGVVVVATMSSTTSNRTVSADSPYKASRPPSATALPAAMMCHYDVTRMHHGTSLAVMSGHHRTGSLRWSARNVPGDCLPVNGQVMVEASNGRTGWVSARHLSRQTIVVFLSTRYAVQGVRHGHHLPVWARTGRTWRVTGTLRWNDHHVTAAILDLRRTTTVIVIVGHRFEAVTVPAHSAIVIADNGRIGIISLSNLTRMRSPMPIPSQTMPTTPMSPSPMPSTVTPQPTGSQSPVINGLNSRTSSKW